jgi:hypothetical protein
MAACCLARCGMLAAAAATDHHSNTAPARHGGTRSVGSRRSLPALPAARAGRAVTPPVDAVLVAPSTRTTT